MAFNLPPPPVNVDPKDPAFRDWFYKLAAGLKSAFNVYWNQLLGTAPSVPLDTAAPGTGGVGIITWNDQDGTIEVGLKGGNVVLQIGQEELIRVVNKTGSDITDGTVVYISGAQGNRPKIDLAKANSELTSTHTIGFSTENIVKNQEGFITTSGLVHGLNTTTDSEGHTLTDGDILYLSASVAGGYTNVEPVAPQHLVVLGYVIRAHSTQGQIFVKVNNGFELNELHNVLITGPTNGQGLLYNSATGLWTNQTISGVGGSSKIYEPVAENGEILFSETTGDVLMAWGGENAS